MSDVHLTTTTEELVDGTVRSVDGASWFVPSAGSLPSAELVAWFGGDSVEVTIDGSTPDAPPELLPPVLGSAEGWRTPNLTVAAAEDVPDGWFEIALAVDEGAWSEPAPWSGAEALVLGDGAGDDVESCSTSVSFAHRSQVSARVRAVALDGQVGSWSSVATITIE